MIHLHRCNFHRLGGPEEQCPKMWECEDDCVEDEIETEGFCAEHEQLAQELMDILDGRVR